MSTNDLLARISSDPKILADYPVITREDVHACLAYAHAVIAKDSLAKIRVG